MATLTPKPTHSEHRPMRIHVPDWILPTTGGQKQPTLSPLDEIKRIRGEYVRGDLARAGLLSEALEAKRAEQVADRILELEAQLPK